MKNLLRIFLLLLIFLCFSQCSSHDGAIKRINQNLDSIDVIFTKPKLDSAKIRVISGSINDFIKKYPNDSMSPKFLLALGITYQKAGMYEQAIFSFHELLQKYPLDSSSASALFYEAFLYANVIHRPDSAQILYQFYLTRYRNRDSSACKIAESELKNLGKIPPANPE